MIKAAIVLTSCLLLLSGCGVCRKADGGTGVRMSGQCQPLD